MLCFTDSNTVSQYLQGIAPSITQWLAVPLLYLAYLLSLLFVARTKFPDGCLPLLYSFLFRHPCTHTLCIHILSVTPWLFLSSSTSPSPDPSYLRQVIHQRDASKCPPEYCLTNTQATQIRMLPIVSLIAYSSARVVFHRLLLGTQAAWHSGKSP